MQFIIYLTTFLHRLRSHCSMRFSANCFVFRSLISTSNWAFVRFIFSSSPFSLASASAPVFSSFSGVVATRTTEQIDSLSDTASSLSLVPDCLTTEFIDWSSSDSFLDSVPSLSATSIDIWSSLIGAASVSSVPASPPSVKMLFYFFRVSLIDDAWTLMLPSRPEISLSSCEIKFISSCDLLDTAGDSDCFESLEFLVSAGMSTIGNCCFCSSNWTDECSTFVSSREASCGEAVLVSSVAFC
mmetsp:Transcript_2502/g.3463  ORF Transcript_2502/g.3463 Transcript_2502/m.3463 type:complete len:242 (-) Transcript_2502:1438-2163(-)